MGTQAPENNRVNNQEKMTYSEKLKNPRWQKKRLYVLKRDKWKCRLCGDTETPLNVHHLKYLGEPWDAPDDCLITYCEDCHKVAELGGSGGLVFIDGVKKVFPGITLIVVLDKCSMFHFYSITGGEAEYMIVLNESLLSDIIKIKKRNKAGSSRVLTSAKKG